MQGREKTRTAVIGGGMAGILTAWLLKEAGEEALVLEAAEIGSGQTGRTTAKITSQHGLIYGRLLENKDGGGLAAAYAAANQTALAEYRRIIEGHGIQCGFRQLPAYLYTRENPEALQAEEKAARSLGLPAAFTLDTSLPFPVMGALRFDEQALFQPLDFLRALSKELRIYEHTPVIKLEDGQLTTPGGLVEAKQVVFATHYPFLNRPGYYFTRLHQERSYVLALKNGPDLGGMYYGVDADGYSFRPAGDYLLFGGENHRTGENREGGRYEGLARAASQLFPGCPVDYAWSAQDCMTPDGIPYAGRYSEDRPEWYVASGFNKWGMTGSMAAALLLRDLILGRENPWAAAFSPQAPGRLLRPQAAENLLSDGLKAVESFGRRLLPAQAAEPAELRALPQGQGIISQIQGEKLGLYRDEAGRLHAVGLTCPHLGCQLTFNPDEKSWDCPCHGSRFTYTGQLIDNPAQEGLHHEILPRRQ
ncbi:MAG: FAD-dependent oxidoreductase [Peptococcaceae bacterium]|nr:FAD-dependent oxidoreductase [Peptococcaceae bacterium]